MNRVPVYLRILSLPVLLCAATALSTDVAAQDRVIVRPRTLVIHRSGKLVRDFPERRTATVRYPIVSGLSNVNLLRRIQKALAIKNVFDTSLEEYRQASWLLDFDFKVNYNKNFLLDVTFTQEGMGAYPSTGTKHFLISLKSGMVVKAPNAFNAASLATLAHLADQKLKAEIKDLIKENQADSSTDAEQKNWVRDELNKLEIKVQDLDEFSVSDKGVTFLYDADFPHVIQALQPNGQYFFSYAELRSYIRTNGPLGVFK